MEISLCVVANGTLFRSSLADNDMAAVGALPDAITFAREDNLILDVLEEFTVTLLVVFLDLCYHRKLGSNLGESLFFSKILTM